MTHGSPCISMTKGSISSIVVRAPFDSKKQTRLKVLILVKIRIHFFPDGNIFYWLSLIISKIASIISTKWYISKVICYGYFDLFPFEWKQIWNIWQNGFIQKCFDYFSVSDFLQQVFIMCPLHFEANFAKNIKCIHFKCFMYIRWIILPSYVSHFSFEWKQDVNGLPNCIRWSLVMSLDLM